MSLLLLLAIALEQPPAAAPEFREFRGSRLFAVDPRSEQRYPTVTVPYRPDAICYEWVLFFAAEDRTVTVRETLEMPAAPASWGDAPAQGAWIDPDGRRAVTEFSDSLADGQIDRRWCVGEGDPLGPYVIRVQAGDRLVEEIRFTMVADAP
jgi:hypothetical protein